MDNNDTHTQDTKLSDSQNSDINKQSSSLIDEKSSVLKESNVSDLEKEILEAFNSDGAQQDTTSSSQETSSLTNDLLSDDSDFPYPSLPDEPKISPQEVSDLDQIQKGAAEKSPTSQQQSIEELQQSIASDLGQAEPQKDEIQSDLGIEKTYYQDLSRSMNANEPQTMSELLKRSAFEQKETQILSPTSRKNIAYIIGALLLMLISIGAWFFLFSSNSSVEYISEQKVDALVYSDEDLGVNITGLQSFETKAAIRKVLERKHPADSLSQIYYVQQDDFANLRRLGVQNIFEATENQTPELLYENIENEFMHGVYTTDKNYPFLILKTSAYDRAFEGMKEWEPTMIDDLATYFDLPPEATDRSLLEDGFSDDLIKNKNVRVARFIPRDSDRRGFFDFLSSQTNDSDGSTNQIENPSEQQNEEADIVDLNVRSYGASLFGFLSKSLSFITAPWKAEHVLAQNAGGIGGVFLEDAISYDSANQNEVCYRSQRYCVNTVTGAQLPSNLPDGTENTFCYDRIIYPNDGSSPQRFSPQDVQGQLGYSCRSEIRVQSVELEQTTPNTQFVDVVEEIIPNFYTEPVCFDPITGERASNDPVENDIITDSQGLYSQICFDAYQCNRIICFDDFQGGQEVSFDRSGEEGVSCLTTNQEVSIDFDGPKSCMQFTEILFLKNINNLNLCFDQNGQYVPFGDRTQGLADYYFNDPQGNDQLIRDLNNSYENLTCISPIERRDRLCLTDSGEIILAYLQNNNGEFIELSSLDQGISVCFDPLIDSLGIEDPNQLNTDIREMAASIAQRLDFLGALASGFGFLDNSVSTALFEMSDVFWQIAEGNILDIEIAYIVATNARNLEQLLDTIDPGVPDSELVYDLRELIQLIKDFFGLNYSILWEQLGNQLSIISNPIYVDSEVEQIYTLQESLSLLGLLQGPSVSGELDALTIEAVNNFQTISGLDSTVNQQTVYVGLDTLGILSSIAVQYAGNYGDENPLLIVDYLSDTLGIGSFGQEVAVIEMLLYIQGYDILYFDGIFDSELCLVIQEYQIDQGLQLSDPQTCIVPAETINSLNQTILDENYLNSGFYIDESGRLVGVGGFSGTNGPGSINFGISEAEASSLREGDVVLLYTFLDEETILITRNESVITEIIQRRALDDIFN